MSLSPIRLFGAIVIVVAVVSVGWAFLRDDDRPATASTAAGRSSPTTAAETPAPLTAAEIPDLGAMPEIRNISGWLNTEANSFEDVRTKVTIVQFWAFGCSNCKATLPHLQDLYASRRASGLEIIGIHAHEFDRERVPENVATAVVDLGVTWPVALDTDKTNFREWQGSRRFWPRIYVIDSENRIRFDHIGEGAYDELAATVDALLADQS